jgi:hypothetical protein
MYSESQEYLHYTVEKGSSNAERRANYWYYRPPTAVHMPLSQARIFIDPVPAPCRTWHPDAGVAGALVHVSGAVGAHHTHRAALSVCMRMDTRAGGASWRCMHPNSVFFLPVGLCRAARGAVRARRTVAAIE